MRLRMTALPPQISAAADWSMSLKCLPKSLAADAASSSRAAASAGEIIGLSTLEGMLPMP